MFHTYCAKNMMHVSALNTRNVFWQTNSGSQKLLALLKHLHHLLQVRGTLSQCLEHQLLLGVVVGHNLFATSCGVSR